MTMCLNIQAFGFNIQAESKEMGARGSVDG
jgi:hypothetical protein